MLWLIPRTGSVRKKRRKKWEHKKINGVDMGGLGFGELKGKCKCGKSGNRLPNIMENANPIVE